jgi:hypothetical protein
MRLFLIIISFFIIRPIIAQTAGYAKDSVFTVIVHKDPRFDELAAKQAEINKRSQVTAAGRRNGFRIQAANTQNRDEANAVKAELLRRFPDEKCYLLYQAPNFRVRIGNFLTQKDAFHLRRLISAMFPQKGVFIVPDIIEYTPPATEEANRDK